MTQVPPFVVGDRPWFAHYPAGVAPLPQPLPFDNLADLVRSSATLYGDRIAYTTVLPNGMEGSLTFAEVDRLSDAFAAWLGAHGVGRGERVAIMLPNCLAYPVCAFGAFKAGAVVVNTNPLYTDSELEHQLRDAAPAVLVVLDKFADKAARAAKLAGVRVVLKAGVGDFFPFFKSLLIGISMRLGRQIPRADVRATLASAISLGAVEAARRATEGRTDAPAMRRDDLAMLQYTGGTTGTSKAAMLTHGNLLANVEQIAEITRGYIDSEEVTLTALPLYHIFAFSISLLYPFHRGHQNLLIPDPRPVAKLRPAFRAHGVTWMSAVNTLLRALLNEDWFNTEPPRRLKSVYAGGMEVHADVFRRWEQVTGSLVIEGFGLTEASPLVTYNPAVRDGLALRRTLERAGGVGLPLPGTDVRIVDDAGNTIHPGEPGEIAVRGPQVMAGYWRQPEETARVLRDGWLYTGDIGVVDATGYIDVTDRKKDLIVVSGFKVYPTEVEACIASHPDVAEVAVLGVPDDMTGEAVRAFVVPRNPALTPQEILAHCRKMLTSYKLPRGISFLGELPKSPVGKTLRRELRKQFAVSS